MSELYQSAYKSCHSTETALAYVCDDIKLAFDKIMETALIMIDLSAAFDTINHDILLRDCVIGMEISAMHLNG